MKTIHKNIKIRIDTLDCFGEYVDFIKIPEENVQIRLVIQRDTTIEKQDYSKKILTTTLTPLLKVWKKN